MARQVLFIQGGGQGAYEEDALMASYLQENLGPDYQVKYPFIAALEEPKPYPALRSELATQLANLDRDALVVGHSLGGASLLKFLSEEKPDKPIAALFLAAIPYFGRDEVGWGNDEFSLESSFGSRLPEALPVFLYHSRDDEWIPFEHLRRHAEQMPNATVREIERGGHQFESGIPELIRDVKNI
jgi:predicted alpha/beta hydrolase family esterase